MFIVTEYAALRYQISFLLYFGFSFILKTPVETDQSSLSDLGLHCLPISQIYDLMLIVAFATANLDRDACKPL